MASASHSSKIYELQFVAPIKKTHGSIIKKTNQKLQECTVYHRQRADSLDVWRCVREATAKEIKSGIINIIVGTRLGANSMFCCLIFLFVCLFQLRGCCIMYIYLAFFICIFSMFTHGSNKMQWAIAHVVNADRFSRLLIF